MGTAFAFPCSDNNHFISIIGTHLENKFIDEINLKKMHPALNCNIPKNTKFFKFQELENEINRLQLLVAKYSDRQREINKMVYDNPNDMSLGKKIRNMIWQDNE